MIDLEYRNIRFDVFQGTDSEYFAFGVQPDKSAVVLEKVSKTSVPSIRTLTSLAATILIGKKIREGYRKSKSPMYFDPIEHVFTHVHPDLYWGGKDWILAACPPTVQEGTDVVAEAMSKIPRNVIAPVEVTAWAKRQKQNSAYIVAFKDLPVWSLVVAEVALQRGWVVRANPEFSGAPSLLPSMNPLQWDEWLQPMFELKLIRRTRAELGYTLDNINRPEVQELIDSENWSSLI